MSSQKSYSAKQVKIPFNKLPEHHRVNLDKNLCVCNEVPKIKIIHAILDGANTVSKVREKTYATDGNGCCRVQVEYLIDYLTDEEDQSSNQ